MKFKFSEGPKIIGSGIITEIQNKKLSKASS